MSITHPHHPLCSVSKNSEIKSLPSELHGRHARHCPNHTRPVWTKISSAHLPSPILGHQILLNTHFSYTRNLQSSLKQDRVPQSIQNKMLKLLLSHARTHARIHTVFFPSTREPKQTRRVFLFFYPYWGKIPTLRTPAQSERKRTVRPATWKFRNQTKIRTTTSFPPNNQDSCLHLSISTSTE